MAEDTQLDLQPGDFLYQSDQELFLVVMENRDDSYFFAVHGWREIGDDRLDTYLDNPDVSKLHDKQHIDQLVEDKDDDQVAENYERLKELFEQYARDFDTDGPSNDWTIDDTE